MDLNFPTGSQVPEWPSDSWHDPEAERNLLRRRLRRARFGFSMLGMALVLAGLATVGQLILVLTGHRQPIGVMLGLPRWELIEQSIIVWGSLLGVALLGGRWPDEDWWKRAGLLLLMCLIDAALWGLDNARELGLQGGEVGHDWFRYALGAAIGWSEFALIASLGADMAAHLGEPQAIDFARAVRSLATTGAMVWLMWFFFRTNWNPPLWPLRNRPGNPGTDMLWLGWNVLWAILMIQDSGLSLLAARCCGRALREMDAEDRAKDLLPSRSEAGWEEFNRPSSRPKGGA